MFNLEAIQWSDFVSRRELFRKDLFWFYSLFKPINENNCKFLKIIYDNVEVGILFNFNYISTNEKGFIIYDTFKRIGLGRMLLSYLKENTDNTLTFSVSIRNKEAMFFFNKMVQEKILKKEKSFKNKHEKYFC